MERHFLEGEVDGPQAFKAGPWYDPHGDCITYQIADEAVIAQRVDEILTVYRSAIDARPIGYQIKGVLALIQKLGWHGVACASDETQDQVTSISLGVLLLAAYEDEPKTDGRRHAYASAFDHVPSGGIPRDQLIAA